MPKDAPNSWGLLVLRARLKFTVACRNIVFHVTELHEISGCLLPLFARNKHIRWHISPVFFSFSDVVALSGMFVSEDYVGLQRRMVIEERNSLSCKQRGWAPLSREGKGNDASAFAACNACYMHRGGKKLPLIKRML